MDWIKCVAEIPERLTVEALPPAVQPNRYKRQYRKSLLRELKIVSEQGEFIGISSQHLHIQYIHTYQLEQAVFPIRGAEKIKHQNHKHACAEIIHHCGIARNIPQQRN